MRETAIIDGQAVDLSQSGLDPIGRAFRFGDGVFESIRLRKNKVLFWDEHMQRLERGLDALGIEHSPLLPKLLRTQVDQVLRANEIHGEARLRIQLFRAGRGAYRPASNKARSVVEASFLERDLWSGDESISVGVAKELQLAKTPWSSAKTCNALVYVQAARLAEERKLDDLILFCGEQVSEISDSNIFLVREGTVISPDLDAGCVEGVMRGQILRIAESLGVEVELRNVTTEDLLEADEVFVTNVIRGIRGVEALSHDGRTQNLQAFGPTTRRIRDALLETHG